MLWTCIKKYVDRISAGLPDVLGFLLVFFSPSRTNDPQSREIQALQQSEQGFSCPVSQRNTTHRTADYHPGKWLRGLFASASRCSSPHVGLNQKFASRLRWLENPQRNVKKYSKSSTYTDSSYADSEIRGCGTLTYDFIINIQYFMYYFSYNYICLYIYIYIYSIGY
jgi:hypothetical protein